MLMAKYQSLQKYAMELTERETKIARERLELNQERLNLQSQRKKLFETRCSLCKIGEKANELKGIIQQDSSMNDFDDINTANNEVLHGENFQNIASSISNSSIGYFNNHDALLMPTTDLENLPTINDVNDDLLDPDLLALKFDILHHATTNFWLLKFLVWLIFFASFWQREMSCYLMLEKWEIVNFVLFEFRRKTIHSRTRMSLKRIQQLILLWNECREVHSDFLNYN